jgi:hypothetical protein
MKDNNKAKKALVKVSFIEYDHIVNKRTTGIRTELKRINVTLEKIYSVMPKPENKAVRALELLVLFAGALGIINAVDVVRKWFIGG